VDVALVDAAFIFVMAATIGLLAWAVGVAMIVTVLFFNWIAKHVYSSVHKKQSESAKKPLWP